MKVISAENIGIKYNLHHKGKQRVKRIFSKSNLWRKKHKEIFWALKGVSFDVGKGDILGIIGKNGSGKTTLLRVLGGILPPDEGRIQVKGKVSPLLSLGIGFKPDLTGIDNIYLNGIFLGLTQEEINAKLPSIIEFSELGKFIDIQVRSYSSGMISRLAFSIAINVEPDILLIDEILGVGDRSFQEKSRKKMLEFIKKAKAIVVVTHNTGFLEKFCNRAILIDEGKIQNMGEPSRVIKNYLRSR